MIATRTDLSETHQRLPTINHRKKKISSGVPGDNVINKPGKIKAQHCSQSRVVTPKTIFHLHINFSLFYYPYLKVPRSLHKIGSCKIDVHTTLIMD